MSLFPWVTDPLRFQKEVSRLQHTIIQKFPLGNGRVSYLSTWDPIFYEVLPTIGYLPLTLTLKYPSSSELTQKSFDLSIRDETLNGIRSILQALIPRVTGIPVSSISVTFYRINDDRFAVFSPLTSVTNSVSEVPIYFAPIDLPSVMNICNPQRFVGYERLSPILRLDMSESLLGYILNFIGDHPPVKVYYGVYLLKQYDPQHTPDGTPRLDSFGGPLGQYVYFKDHIEMLQTRLKYDGYFALSIPQISPDDFELYLELAEMWSTQYVGTYALELLDSEDTVSPRKVLVLRNNTPYKSEWFQKSLIEIRQDLLPSVIVSGPWIDVVTPTPLNRVRMTYAGLRALAQVAISDPFLFLYFPDFEIGDDLAVTARFAQLDEVEQFREAFLFYLRQSDNWTVFLGPDLATCLGIRAKVTGHPFIISYRDTYYVVVDSSSVERPLVDKEDIVNLARQLVEAYSSIVSEEMNDPVEVISLISQRTHINPFFFWSGLATVGPLPGLFDELPAPSVPPCDGTLSFTSVEDLTYVQVHFTTKDGVEMVSDLAVIPTKDFSPKEVEDAWKSGSLLSNWCRVRCFLRGKMSLRLLPFR